MCENKSFRNDLYYRLSVFPIEVPPLRERKEDIPIFVETFLKNMENTYSKGIHRVDPQVFKAFTNYAWPGNIRELENLIERAYIIETSEVLTPESFPNELFTEDATSAPIPIDTELTLNQVRQKSIDNVERSYLKELLSANKGSIKDTARQAGITPRQLHKLLTKYSIRKEEFKPQRFTVRKSESAVPK
jgi:DNA-binding NtrC family response regulator